MANRLEKIHRGFLWGGVSDEFKIHLVNWNNCCTPVCCNSWGIKRLLPLNQALLDKWLRHFSVDHNALLWRQVIEFNEGSALGNWSSGEV